MVAPMLRLQVCALAALSICLTGCPEPGCEADDRCVIDSGVDAGFDAGVVDAGDPIVAEDETWTWVDFPESFCGNGAPTGLGVNLTSRSTDVLIYLAGGGACWNAITCGPLNAAININTGYGESSFTGDVNLQAGPFQRAVTTNPFRDMSYVYVPYCTGDVHSGDAVTTHPGFSVGGQTVPEKTVHHRGAHNLRLFLERLRDTFPAATRVFVSGSSAGAYGAQFNYPAVAEAFPGAEVHVYADCGQLINPSGTLGGEWAAAWNLQVPAACTGCMADFALFPPYLAATYPDARFGLLAYTRDSVLRQFFGYDATNFETRTRALLSAAYAPAANARYFVATGEQHVMLGNFDGVSSEGVSLRDWTTGFVAGDATWSNVLPPPP